MREAGSDCRSPCSVQSPGAAPAVVMSLLLPEYEAQLLAEMDEEGEDIPAEEMTPDVRRFYDQLFQASRKTPSKRLALPRPTDVPPGPLRVAVYRQRFQRKQVLFHSEDFKGVLDEARVVRKVTKRNPKNGNPLGNELMEERDVLNEMRADEAARKARRS